MLCGQDDNDAWRSAARRSLALPSPKARRRGRGSYRPRQHAGVFIGRPLRNLTPGPAYGLMQTR
eukprot:scaffold1575_cov352-Prasinococcus_capsulatus_cf.AAC.13